MTKNRSFYFSDGPYIQVLKALVGALTLPEAFVKLLGNPHTGKSALCSKLTQYLRRKGVKVILFDTAIESPDMLRAALAQEFDLPLSSNFARILEDALQEQKQKRVILVFDDAHLLTDITLIEIYRLAEVQVNKKRLLNILLCGEPSLEKRLLSNREFKSLLLNVSHKFKLEPMNDEELSQFFYRFVDKAGLPGLQLEQSAMSYFFKLCKGFPGPAANISQLIVAARKNSAELHPVTKTELASIFSAANGQQSLPSTGFRYTNRMSTLIPFVAVILIVSVGLVYRQLNQPRDGNSLDTALQSLAVDTVESNSPLQVDQTTEMTRAAASGSIASPTDSAVLSEAGASFREQDEPSAAAADALDTNDGEPSELELNTAADASEVQSGLPVATAGDISDSGLALVTAEERGIDLAAIAEPEFDSSLQAQVADATQEITAGNTAQDTEEITEEITVENIEESAQESALVNTQNNAPAVVQESLAESAEMPSADAGLEQQAPALEAVIVVEPAEQLAQVSIQEDAVPTDAPEDAAAGLDLADPTVPAPVLIDGNNESGVAADTSSDSDLGVLQQFVASWIDAWQAQSLDTYFTAYHSEFEPRYQESVSAWRSSRERVIGNAGWIELELSDFQFIGEEAGVVEVHFWLNYRSPTYQDDTQKKLLLGREAGEWRILEEINLQVRS